MSGEIYYKGHDRLPAKVAGTLRRHRLLESTDIIWLAVSGGADSIGLLHVLRLLLGNRGPSLRVLHVNHGLRGAASQEDEDFVRNLCAGLDLPLTVKRVRIPPPAGRAGESLEMTARRLRLQVYHEVCRPTQGTALATGHQADDVAETLMLRLSRGAGAGGLSALSARSMIGGLRLLRPLINCSRREIETWLEEKKLPWRTDKSNRDLTIPRNKLRHRIIPWLEENGMPGLRQSLVISAEILREDDRLLEELAGQALGRCRIPGPTNDLSAGRIVEQPPALRRRLVRQWLWSLGETAAGHDLVDRIIALARGPDRGALETPLGNGTIIRRSYDRMTPAPSQGLSAPGGYIRLRIPGPTMLADGRVINSIVCAYPGDRRARILPGACGIYLDARVWAGRLLRIRYPRPGDRMKPAGCRGSRKLHDLWIDAKIPRDQRPLLPLLLCGETIIWAPGLRPARGWPARRGRPALYLAVGEKHGAGLRLNHKHDKLPWKRGATGKRNKTNGN